MKKLYILLTFLILSPLSVDASSSFAQASNPLLALTTSTPVTTPSASPAISQLGQNLQSLVGVGSSVGSGTSQPTASTANDNSDDTIGQISDTFATDVLDALAHTADTLKANTTILETVMTAEPDFANWFEHQRVDAHRQILWRSIANDLLIIVGPPLLIGIALSLLLLPLRLQLRRNQPLTLPGRMGLLFGLFLTRIVPVFIFMGVALLLLDQNEAHRLPRYIVLSVVYALALAYSVQQILRALFAPRTSHLRLFDFATPRAVSAFRWSSAFNFAIVYGYFIVDLAFALRVPKSAITAFQDIFALILAIMAVCVIFDTRLSVAKILHGKIEEDAHSFAAVTRAWFARHWHRLATGYVVISLIIMWLGVSDGFALMIHGTIFSILILIADHIAFLAIDGWASPRTNGASLMHRQMLAFILRPFIWAISVAAIAVTWGFDFHSFISTESGQRISGAILTVGITLFILTVLYEILNASIDRHLNRKDKTSTMPVASARARTLLPMVRNSVFILFCGIAVIACLSSIGINIGPLLAGAGVVGVAIGFGSQTLVKDFLTGLFIVIENTIAVGDVVKIDSFSGVVEALSIRTIRLRDSDGSLHILPFSEVTKITNMSKGFAYALVDIGVSYDSDLEHVMKVMRSVGAEIQEDPVFKRVILEPIEVLGVENLGDSSITIRARIRTRPGKQWDVKRLLLLRLKQRFDKEKIEIPYPTATHLTKMI